MPVNAPAVRVVIAGALIDGVIALVVEQMAYFAADRFAVTLAVGEPPLCDIAALAGLSAKQITIEIATGMFGFQPLITGQIDNIAFDLGTARVILTGRDLSARLIDAEITMTFANQTSSQIATTLAGQYGLAANVTATTTPVGQYYELDHAHSSLGINSRTGTVWALLTSLAHLENFDVSVSGTTLNFGPPAILSATVVDKIDCLALKLDVAAVIPKQAVVKSWNTRNKAAVTQNAGSAGQLSATLIKPNLTIMQAAQMAKDHLATLSAQTTILTMTIPGEVSLTPAMPLLLTGTGSLFDQIYMIDCIKRVVDANAGFVETITAHAVAA